MAETDILNPSRGYDRTLGDNINPNIGWQRSRQSSLAIAKPAFGAPWSRETANNGVRYQLSFTKRSLCVIERLQRFADQFESGFFTLIDHDTCRHYVGRFVGEMPVTKELGKRFSATNWTFEEIPGCPMLEYPGHWERWAVVQRPFDDYGDLKLALSSTTAGAWWRPAAVVDAYGISRQPRQVWDIQPTIGDWATFEYRGYGFRLWLCRNPNGCVVQIVVDGVIVVNNLNLASATDLGPCMVYEAVAMPLDIHRVKVIITAVPALSNLMYDRIEVMR